jgi:hypothetical protein
MAIKKTQAGTYTDATSSKQTLASGGEIIRAFRGASSGNP